MKKALLPLFIFISLLAQSQALYNEWIDYSKTYYKFKVPATGMYRISQSALSSIGLGTTPAEQFQLWRNGQQIPLYTSVQSGVLGSSDFIEFYGEMNDGRPDKDLYRIPDHQINDKWSLETDTAIYFLTTNTGANLRLVPTASGLPTALTPEPYFINKTGTYFKEKYHLGFAAVVGDYVYASDYENGEGYTSSDIANGATRSMTYTNLKPFTGPGAPAPQVRVTAAGNALLARQFEVKLGGVVIGTTTMDYFDYVKNTYTADIANISSGTAQLDIKNLCPSANDRMVIGQAELTYPRNFDFNGVNNFYFELPANNSSSYLEISNFNYGSSAPVLMDLTNGKRYTCDIANPSLVKVVLLPSSLARRMVLISTDPSFVPAAVTSFQQRNFVNYSLAANQGNYLIISHDNFTTSSVGQNPLTEYLNYRNSTEGGSYTAKAYMIDQLIDQFAYGIKRHPLSVRNFLRYARANFGSAPKAVLLMGKGLQYIHNRVLENNTNLDKLSFIPSFGYPPSDNLLSADYGQDVLARTPIGRLSVINGDEVLTYLRKLKQYEQALKFQSPLIADKAWMKNIIHVIGSGDGVLGNQITISMDAFRGIISDTFYGANVTTFSKLSTAPVEQTNITNLYNLFETGTGLLTYFGHSSASTLEFNLDNPDGYNNPGKYPLFILLGCNAGNFFNYNVARLQTKETISEKFVLAEQRGSIATIASTGLGIVYYLDILNRKIMNSMSNTKYGKSLGEILIQGGKEMFDMTTQNDFYSRFHIEQSAIHGDPAVKMDIFSDKPDYAIEDRLVQVQPTFVSVANTNFEVHAKFMNLSKAINNKLVVEFKRIMPDQTSIIRRDTLNGIRYMDSINYVVPIYGINDKGLNKIIITIDPDNAIQEIYETNNTISKDFYIYEDEARPVFPYDLSIVNTQNLKFKASTANPFDVTRAYRIEVDTTSLFNSALKVSQDISTTGGLLEFNPSISFIDSTVYYWRVAPVSSTLIWNTSSFIFISSGTKGFNQSHFYQHFQSKQDRLSMRNNRAWVYDSTIQNLFARNTIFPEGGTQQSEFTISINNDPIIGGGCNYHAIIFNVFNPVTLAPWKNVFTAAGGLYESLPQSCGPKREYNFEYSYFDTAGRRKAMNFLNNVVPAGYYVVARANLPSTPSSPPSFPNVWQSDTLLYGSGNSLYHILKNQGFAVLDSFNRPRTWVFAYRKNMQANFRSLYTMAETIFDKLTLNIDVPTPSPKGIITSPVFGPAKNWKNVYSKGTALPDVNIDSTALNIIGITSGGAEQVLYTGLNPDQLSFDISAINATQYPFLKLNLYSRDSINITAYQLKRWMATYDPVPEGAIAPNIYLSAKDTVDIGEPLAYKLAFKNVSEVPFDSVKVKLSITDKNNNTFAVPLPRRRSLPVNDTLQVGALINTRAIPGKNTLFLDVNPDNDQKEQFHFNNFAYRSLYVKPDSLNPLLDVTFDGQHILNRDIVSSRPSIVVKLKDEAKWMVLDDTSLAIMRVRFPNGSLRRYYFNNDTLRFVPAGQAPNTDNTATINFNPAFLADGEYELIVSGKDKSSNSAGAMEYRVLFQVINKAMISNMLNYPNPFTTSTAFVFTVTGNEVPQNLKIEIMTVTGRIVREITKDELGPIHIGRNITEFKWDGTDQFGQKLGNGVYLYRVVTNLNGKSLEKYTSEGEKTDKYFNKGYGKMYLMR